MADTAALCEWAVHQSKFSQMQSAMPVTEDTLGYGVLKVLRVELRLCADKQ